MSTLGNLRLADAPAPPYTCCRTVCRCFVSCLAITHPLFVVRLGLNWPTFGPLHPARHACTPPAHPQLCRLPLLPCVSGSLLCLFIQYDLCDLPRFSPTQNLAHRTTWRTHPPSIVGLVLELIFTRWCSDWVNKLPTNILLTSRFDLIEFQPNDHSGRHPLIEYKADYCASFVCSDTLISMINFKLMHW
jgi:hypothetical protein